jgi:hypothetical protein
MSRVYASSNASTGGNNGDHKIRRREGSGRRVSEFIANLLDLNGIELSRYYVAAVLGGDAMGTLICSYPELLRFMRENDGIILRHLLGGAVVVDD